MADNYIGEIKMFAGNFAPAGWMFCDGTTLPIAENDALFTLLGTTYGGDGQETFNLPDLRGRFPIHQGTGPFGTTYQIGEASGTEAETITVNQMPTHSHPPTVSNTAGSDNPTDNMWAISNSGKPYANIAGGVQVNMNAALAQPIGGSQPHDNMHPFLAINYIISLFGIFPTQ